MHKTEISKVKAREIFDSRGNPTLSATIMLEDGSVGDAAVHGAHILPYGTLSEQARRLAGRGEYRLALSFLMQSLLRRLGDLDVLKLHRSKTNGEYVREFPSGSPCKDDFGRFVLAFDVEIYGGRPSGRLAFDRMSSMSERIISNVVQGP